MDTPLTPARMAHVRRNHKRILSELRWAAKATEEALKMAEDGDGLHFERRASSAVHHLAGLAAYFLRTPGPAEVQEPPV